MCFGDISAGQYYAWLVWYVDTIQPRATTTRLRPVKLTKHE